jgi:hypothetical protein
MTNGNRKCQDDTTPSSADKVMRRAEAEMLRDERAKVAMGRNRPNSQTPWLGLALSGGGIRSATFCLGALQALARDGLLRHFDYVSSVSGGGYASSALQWKWHDSSGSDTGSRFPYGTAAASSLESENESLKYLRWHASYLAPGGGISIWSAIAVLLRTLLISMFVWVPIATTVMVALFIVTGAHNFYETYSNMGEFKVPSLQAMTFTIPWLNLAVSNFTGGFLAILIFLVLIAVGGTVFLAIISILIPPETINNRGERIARACRCAVIGVTGLAISYGAQKHFAGSFNVLDPTTSAIAISLQGFGAFAFCSIIVGICQAVGWLEIGFNYASRRRYEISATKWFPSLIACGLLASLPPTFEKLSNFLSSYPTSGAAIVATLTVASGFLSGLYGHFVQAQRLAPQSATRWAACAAAGIFLYLGMLLAYAVARFLISPSDIHLTPAQGQVFREYFFAILIFSLAFGYWSNVNYLGLHRFYRDRLMEAFLPSDEQKAADDPNYSDADRIPLADFWPPTSPRPYPILNTNVILVHDRDQTLALRGGASFQLSPLYLGSSATGWLATGLHDKRHGPITLASAMAASGAAANANAGYIGTGITRERLVSIVMMLLNLRLGLWIGAPNASPRRPNYFSPGLSHGIFRRGYRHDSNYLELTDGGHFENLGIYELIRRRCDLIVALDSEEDPATAMSALASACQRVREDFGAEVMISTEADAIAPTDSMGYPSDAKFVKQPYFVVTIKYPEETRAGIREGEKTGTFVYVKSGMIKDLSFSAKGYKAKFPEFPNQSTVDQFFDPAQFEAYRELGFASVSALSKAYELSSTRDASALVTALSARSK